MNVFSLSCFLPSIIYLLMIVFQKKKALGPPLSAVGRAFYLQIWYQDTDKCQCYYLEKLTNSQVLVITSILFIPGFVLKLKFISVRHLFSGSLILLKSMIMLLFLPGTLFPIPLHPSIYQAYAVLGLRLGE